jgi:hypothetical protein
MKRVFATMAIVAGFVLSAAAASFVPTWYDELRLEHLPKLATDGCKQVVVYSVGGSGVSSADDHFLNGALAKYLDTANTYGIKVIVSVMWIVQAGDMSSLSAYAAKFKSYPALAGWYVLDEPSANDTDKIASAKHAYGILKGATPSLPIYMAFMLFQWQVEKGGVVDIPKQYKDGYDVLMWDCYSLYRGDKSIPPTYYPEWVDMGDWIASFDNMKVVADGLGKPLMPVLQGYGDNPRGHSCYLRLPSKEEERFMVYYSVNNGARTVSFWEFDWLLDSVATSAPNPYLGTGEQWRKDVGKPVMDEMMLYADAIDRGSVSGAVSGWGSGINGKVYRDSSTGKYYLLTVNTNASASAAFTLTIALPGRWSHLAEYGAGNISIVDNKVPLGKSGYSKYQVRNFELIPAALSILPRP